MANVVRWDPFREIADLQSTMDQFFNRGVGRILARENGADSYFPLDLYETEEDVVVKASLPGARPEDVNVSVNGDVLTIKAETKAESEEKQPNYYRQERRFGVMQRALQLPVRVDADKANADFEHGVLTLHLPKAEEARPKTIEIKPKNVIESSTTGA
jgi:HSP20 family protein